MTNEHDAPRIWTRRPKILEAELVLPIRTRGFFQLTASRNGIVTRQTKVFPNLITTQGLNLIGTASDWLARCAVGTGSNTPNAADTQLQTQVGVTNSVTSRSQAMGGTYYGQMTTIFRFGAGTATGNLTEVGVGIGSGTPLSVFSRALILDDMGSPTTFPVLSDEVLDVTYIFRQYAPTSDVNDTLSITGSGSHDTVLRAANVTTSSAWGPPSSSGSWMSAAGNAFAYETQTLGAITGVPGGTSEQVTSGSQASYTGGNFYRDLSWLWDLTAGNFGSGIGAVLLNMGTGTGGGGGGSFQINFTPRIAKTASNTLSLTARHAWASH